MADWVLPAATLGGAVLITFTCCLRPMRKGHESAARDDPTAAMDDRLCRLRAELRDLEATQHREVTTVTRTGAAPQCRAHSQLTPAPVQGVVGAADEADLSPAISKQPSHRRISAPLPAQRDPGSRPADVGLTDPGRATGRRR